MNNINSVDNTRSVVTDVNVPSSGNEQGPAKTEQSGGKSLPSAVRAEAPERTAEVQNQREVRTQRVERAVEQLNDYVQSFQRDLKFSLDEDLGKTVVSVVDRNTQELIRQIPNETALQLARNLKAMQKVQQVEQVQVDAGRDAQSVEASLGLINTRI